MSASNTSERFTRACIGQEIIGVLFDALPAGRPDLAKGNKTLIFKDGTGLTISNGGTYWLETEERVRNAVKAKWKELQWEVAAMEPVVRLAGDMGLTND